MTTSHFDQQQPKWELKYWRDASGKCNVCDFIADMQRKDNTALHYVHKKMRWYCTQEITHVIARGDLESMKNGLWEFKISVSNICVRMIGVLLRGESPPQFIALHAFRKKTNRIPQKELNTALTRLKTYTKQK